AGPGTPGNITARSILAGSGYVNLGFPGINTPASITQSGTVTGGTIYFGAAGNVSVDDVRGTTVTAESSSGSVRSAGGHPILSTGPFLQLYLLGATGITVNTLAASVQARNTTSGDISITQLSTPATAVTTAGTGVRNEASGGAVTITNVGGAITVAAGSPVQCNNGPIALAATDLNIAGTVNSGTAPTQLGNVNSGAMFDLGTNALGKVGLTQTELNNIAAGALRVGSVTAGAITISAAITA